MKICFAVHRYPPYAGGSEYYVQQMAEEAIRRGHEVNVVAEYHNGDINGVRLSSQTLDLYNKDLIVVHGGGPAVQSYVLENSQDFNSPVLYMLIEPSDHPRCVSGMNNAHFIGCSTIEDWQHVHKWGMYSKSYKVVHGISPQRSLGKQGEFRKNFDIPDDVTMFISCGGYWGNKQMIPLAHSFEDARLDNAVLVTTGYHEDRYNMPKRTDNVIPLILDDPQVARNGIADANCYIMNSSVEGFGLTILESMINRTPWIARNIAGARLLAGYGQVYQTEEELSYLLQSFTRNDRQVEMAHKKVMRDHLISNTVDDILRVVEKS